MNGNLKHTGLILLSGVDAPGITEMLFRVLTPFQIEIVDFEQVVIRDRLLLTVLIKFDQAHQSAIEDDVTNAFKDSGIDLAMDFAPGDHASGKNSNLHLVVLAEQIRPIAIAKIANLIQKYNGNIDRVRRTSDQPIIALEFDITAEFDEDSLKVLQRDFAVISNEFKIDIAVQRGGLIRRAKRVVLLDMDSTLIQQEVIDLLADKVGVGEKVSKITESAMRGDIDFTTSLKERVALLAGASEEIFTDVFESISLTPGALDLIKTLHKLGHKVGVVSGGFLNVIEPLLRDLRIDFYRANTLEVIGGKITGRISGPIINREAKAEALVEFAKKEGVELNQTIAIGDGANDLGMIEIAGLGIAFNAKPKVKLQADASISTPYLDSVLFLMGITRAEINN
jgi:phosphoserine phosphatase